MNFFRPLFILPKLHTLFKKRFCGSIMKFRLIFFILIFYELLINSWIRCRESRLAVVVVLDGCPWQSLCDIKPFVTGGFKYFFDQGTVYQNARYPYAGLSTGPGHTTIATGALPRDHGIVDNSWRDKNNIRVACDDADSDQAAVFAPDGFYDYGKSAENIRVDGIGDQLVVASTRHKKNRVYAIAYKSRAAICMAGKAGKAFWFDPCIPERITSSKAYFQKLPDWVEEYNKQQKKELSWNLVFGSHNHVAYSIVKNPPYQELGLPTLMERTAGFEKKILERYFEYSPASVEATFAGATILLKKALEEDGGDILIMISISGTDKLGHIYGPQSLEFIDLLYHVDIELKKCIDSAYQATVQHGYEYPPLCILTADHGQLPIVELLNDEGFDGARRINEYALTEKLNKKVEKEIGVKKLIKKINSPWVNFNKMVFKNMDRKQQSIAKKIVCKKLKKIDGFADAWSYPELLQIPTQPEDWLSLYKNQLAPGRTADVIFQVAPYTYVTKYKTGTGHNAPYEYSSHVPLICVAPNQLPHTYFDEKVYITQLAPTLAHYFGVQKPSAALYDALPYTEKLTSFSNNIRKRHG